MAIFLAILAISMMIIVHEAGHFFVARWSGMRVDRFSLGFGPPILKVTSKGTQFQLAPILFGGFVHIVGMNPHEDYDEKDPSVYPNRPTILRFLTIFAGPATNMLLAVVLAFSVFTIAGVDVRTGRTVVVDVGKDEPADGQLRPDDLILSVNGQPLTADTFHSQVQHAYGAPMVLKVLRAGREEQVIVTPRFKDGANGYLLGIHIQSELTHQKLGLGRAAVESLRYPIVKSKLILGMLWQIATGKVEGKLSGPVGITSEISKSIQNGWVDAFELLALLNVYLALINLLPFPALDGGRLAFLTYELATRRRPNAKVETAVHLAGGLVLVVIMLLVTYKEVTSKLFS